MITTIDNSQRVFMVTGDMNRHVFCNLQDIEKAVKSFDDMDEVKISHCWNNRFTRFGRTKLKEMLKAHSLNHSWIVKTKR